MRVKDFGQILNVYILDRCFDSPQWVTTNAHPASSKEPDRVAWNFRHARPGLVRLASKFLVGRLVGWYDFEWAASYPGWASLVR